MSTVAAAIALAVTASMSFQAKNPILWADVPDISIVRAGDTYYMSSTTMHLSPGLPIMKSKDLVNWELASYAYETVGNEDAVQMTNGKNSYGGGTWASSLRHHNGTFYVSTFSHTTGFNYIYSTKTPDKTPWKLESKFKPVLHDHSLFFDDDGRVYMLSGNSDIRLTELSADLQGIKPGGTDKIIITNAAAIAGGQPGLAAEGSQLFKVDGKYYLCNISWPRGGMRTEIVHRADKIDGPYEGRIMFRDRGIAQGGIVDTPDGKWYAYLFQDHGSVGRIPWIIPMTWKDGWPVVGENGKAPDGLPMSAGKGAWALVTDDSFDRKPGDRALPLEWQWNHNPDPANWSLTARPGWLRLTTGRVDSQVVEARNTLSQRTVGPTSEATVTLDPSGLKDGDIAGLVALQKQYGFVGVRKVAGKLEMVSLTAPGGVPGEPAVAALAAGPVELRIQADFRNMADVATFSYRQGGGEWKPLGVPLRMRYDLPHFMGYRFGLFNFATTQVGGHADFDDFKIGPAEMPTRFKEFAATPPMGWNSWDYFGTTITETQAKEQADAMANLLKPAGWQYFTVDIQWYEPNSKGHVYKEGAPLAMDEYSRLIPAANRFPSGFKSLADYVHGKGLKFGIHLMRGIARQAVHQKTPILGANVTAADIADTSSVCAWNPDMYGVDMSKPGAQEYYDSLFQQYASWGVDLVKVDDIARPYDDVQEGEIEAIRKAIDKCGRPIVLSLSPGDTPLSAGSHVNQNANMWRISDDFWDEWAPLHGMFGRLEKWTEFRTPGTWPDADMLPFGKIVFGRDTRFTQDELTTCMTLWCIARSPLILGSDMTKLDAFTLGLLTNPEAIAVNQNSINNRQLSRQDDIVVWTADVPDSKDKYVALFNIGDTAKSAILDIDLAGKEADVLDIWSKKTLSNQSGKMPVELRPHASALFRVSP